MTTVLARALINFDVDVHKLDELLPHMLVSDESGVPDHLIVDRNQRLQTFLQTLVFTALRGIPAETGVHCYAGSLSVEEPPTFSGP